MVFDKPNIPGIFGEFAPNAKIELVVVPGLFTYDECARRLEPYQRMLTKEELHYLCAAQLIKPGDESFWGSTEYRPASPDYWYFSGKCGFVTTSNKLNTLGFRHIILPQ